MKANRTETRRVLYCTKNDMYLMGNLQTFEGSDLIVFRVAFTSETPPTKAKFIHGAIHGSVASYDGEKIKRKGEFATWLIKDHNIFDTATPVDEFKEPSQEVIE